MPKKYQKTQDQKGSPGYRTAKSFIGKNIAQKPKFQDQSLSVSRRVFKGQHRV